MAVSFLGTRNTVCRFVEGIGERRSVELVDWSGYARENNSLTSMLKEFIGGGQAAKVAWTEPTGTQSIGRMHLPGDVEELQRFVKERIGVIADPSGERLQSRIVRWWCSLGSQKAPHRVRKRGRP